MQIMSSLAKPFHSVSFGDEEVYCVTFSPFEWSKNFLAIGTKNKVAIANVLPGSVSIYTFLNIMFLDLIWTFIFSG